MRWIHASPTADSDRFQARNRSTLSSQPPAEEGPEAERADRGAPDEGAGRLRRPPKSERRV
jgi:hypothetical protein